MCPGRRGTTLLHRLVETTLSEPELAKGLVIPESP